MKGYRQFLDKDKFNDTTESLKVTRVKQTHKGYLIRLFHPYACIYTKLITLGKNDTAKVLTKVDRNYTPKYRFTVYENSDGEEINLREFRILNK